MKQTVIFFMLQLLRGLPGGDDNVYANVALAEAIGNYVSAEGVVSFLEQNNDVSHAVVNAYLELRFSNLKAMSFHSAEYFLMHWKTIRELWNEAELIRQKVPTMSAEELVCEKRRLQNLCATLGYDKRSLQHATEIVAHAFIT